MRRKKKRFLGIVLGLAIVLGLMPSVRMNAMADSEESTYTLTIPARAYASGSGSITTDGVTASGSVPRKHMLYVSVKSQNDYFLKSRLDEEIHYTLNTRDFNFPNLSIKPGSYAPGFFWTDSKKIENAA